MTTGRKEHLRRRFPCISLSDHTLWCWTGPWWRGVGGVVRVTSTASSSQSQPWKTPTSPWQHHLLFWPVTLLVCYLGAPQQQDGTGNHSLIENPQHHPDDVKRPQPFQNIETALSLHVEDLGVSPVQFFVYMNNSVHIHLLDGTRVTGAWVLLSFTTSSWVIVTLSCR